MRASGSFKCIQDVICSNCGNIGQLKRDLRKTNGTFGQYRVDHYKNHKGILVSRLPMHRMNKKYAYSCYLGKIVVVTGYEVNYPPFTAIAIINHTKLEKL